MFASIAENRRFEHGFQCNATCSTLAWFQRLKRNYDVSILTVFFYFSLCLYVKAFSPAEVEALVVLAGHMGLCMA
jgi:hypothetical protein